VFLVSENGENGLGDEGADGGNVPPPQNFGARTAPACVLVYGTALKDVGNVKETSVVFQDTFV